MQNSGHLRLCQQPWAAHALRSDQNLETFKLLSEISYPKIFSFGHFSGYNGLIDTYE